MFCNLFPEPLSSYLIFIFTIIALNIETSCCFKIICKFTKMYKFVNILLIIQFNMFNTVLGSLQHIVNIF